MCMVSVCMHLLCAGMRDPGTGLLGNTLHVDSAEWLRKDSGIGAGIDSFYEYLLKVGAECKLCLTVQHKCYLHDLLDAAVEPLYLFVSTAMPAFAFPAFS